MKSKYRKAVFVVVYRTNRNRILYLLLKRKLHWKGWEFPKGGVENRESILKSIKREIKEETGQMPANITEQVINGKFRYDKEYADRKGLIGQTYQLFSAEIKNKKIKIDGLEHSNYKWLDFDKAFSLLTWPNQKVCLNYVNKKLMR